MTPVKTCFGPTCWIQDQAKDALSGAVGDFAKGVSEAVGQVVGALGTMWVHVGTPDLDGGGASSIEAGSKAPGAGDLTTVLGYVTWISLVVCIVSLIVLGGRLALHLRAGEGITSLGRIGLVLGATVLISASSAIASAITKTAPHGGGTVLFLQSSLWWYTGVLAMVSVIIGGARMAWEQRAEPGKDLLRSLLTLVIVAGAGVTIVSLLTNVADKFSVWIINGSLDCNVTSDDCFGRNVTLLLGALTVSGGTSGPALSTVLVMVLGLIALLVTCIQVALMIARGGMLVLLTGVLPLTAAMTNTETGRSWFRKTLAWLTAFLLYKPAAAIVYAAAFQLAGQKVFGDDGTGITTLLAGLMLMVLSLLAMPALMRFIAPMTSAMGGGALAGAALGGAAMAMPTGAMKLAEGGRSSSSTTTSNVNPSTSSTSNTSTSTSAPSGSGAAGGSGSRGAPGAAGGQGTAGATGGQGPAGVGSAGATGSTGSVGAAGSAGAGAAGASAAGGPWGAAAAAGLKAAKGAGETAQKFAQDATEEGPSGS